MPYYAFCIQDFTLVEQRVVAIFVFASLAWLLEPIAAWVTSTLTIVLLLFTCSDSCFTFFKINFSHKTDLGTLISHKSLMASFADPVIMLFIGGFFLAMAGEKIGLDKVLARVLFKPFGNKSNHILLGLLVITGCFSMFLSNTATAAMMITMLGPVLKSLDPDDRGRVGLAMAIPIGANIGGMGTPIGTPPNAIAIKFLNDPHGLGFNISFNEWTVCMMPLGIIILIFSWFLLRKLFKFKQETIEIKIDGEFKKDWRSIVTYVTFILTIGLWMTDRLTGVNSNVVAMLPVGVFCATGIITKEDLCQIEWSVLWMVAGGFALGTALQSTGLARHLIENIPFHSWSPLLIMIGPGIICYGFSNFISNTATAALLTPILAIVAGSMADSLIPFGGAAPLIVGLALSASLAMCLPVSTPPNAIAYSTNIIQRSDMIKTGIIIGVVGFVIGYGMLILFGRIGII